MYQLESYLTKCHNIVGFYRNRHAILEFVHSL